MVESKAFILEADIIVNIPEDILQNDRRLGAVREGIKRALTKGLYEQVIDFEIRNLNLKGKYE